MGTSKTSYKVACLLLVAASLSYGAATFKSATQQNADASATTIATPATLNVATADWIVVVVGWFGNPDATATVTCGSDSLTLVTYNTASNYRIGAFYRENATANATATCTGTISTASTFRVILAANFSGVDTTSSVNQSSCNAVGCATLATATTNRTAQNVTTTVANALLLGLVIDWDGGVTHTGANSYVVATGSDGDTSALMYKSVTSTGTHPSGNFSTVSASDEYLSIFMAVEESAGGGPAPRGKGVILQ